MRGVRRAEGAEGTPCKVVLVRAVGEAAIAWHWVGKMHSETRNVHLDGQILLAVMSSDDVPRLGKLRLTPALPFKTSADRPSINPRLYHIPIFICLSAIV